MLLHDDVMDFHILDHRSERCLEPEVALCLPAIGGKRVQVLQPASDSVVACFAFELEQDIAALEAEAKREDESSWDSSVVDDTMGVSGLYIGDQATGEDMDQYHPHQATDSDSDDETELEDDAAARIHANARMVAACGRPLQQGAWKGCTKSAWCDREDRHRGLCNHKASIPGPAACPAPLVTPCSSKQQQDLVHCEGPGASCGAQQSSAPVSSGGHSSHCKPDHQVCDEREVASAFKQGNTMDVQPSMEDTSMPFNCLSDQGCEHEVSAAAAPPLPHAFWTNSSADEEQFLAMPAAYQPLVKDLEAPCIGDLLQADGLCDVDETLNVPVTIVQPVVQVEEVVVPHMSTSSENSACDSLFKPGFSPQSACSAPSSPSCASEVTNMTFDDAAAALAAALASPAVPTAPTCFPHVPTQAIVTAGSATLPAASFVLSNMLPLEEVHPASCMQAAAAAPSALEAAEAVCGTQQYDIAARMSSTGSQFMESCGDDCKEAGLMQAAVQVGADADVPAAAGKAAVGAGPKVALMQRAPRIKVKPRRADDPPRPLLEPSSPKAKKRVAGRLAAHPSSGHCCTQCGAVSTPVWRAGPAGPKTLCNACGVRYMKVARRK